MTLCKNDLDILCNYIMFKTIDICYQTMIYGWVAFVGFRDKLIKREYSKKPFYDLDSSDFAEKSELTETERRERELDEQIAQPGWRAVW